MLHSMTGYGRGEASNSEVTVVVELKSVNNRFRDLQLRCPREYMPLEPRINNMLKDPFHRGRIDAFVRRNTQTSRSRVVVDMGLAEEYVRVIDGARGRLPNIDQTVPLTFILGQAGVLDVTDASVDVMSDWPVVETALQSAIDDLIEMRATEGLAIYNDLKSHLAKLHEVIDQISAAALGINDRLQKRLETRIARMVGDRFEAYRITQEVAILADKADVAEELTRLRSHIDQFSEAMERTEPVGRRLDFLLQEMNREVNTVGSKAVEHPVSQRVVDMKSILERMREQSANVQ
jgi:uncharacterized protein (TIGR00255 family)